MAEKTDLKMRYFEEEYEILTSIGGQIEDSVALVKRRTDGRIYVRKMISLEVVAVYNRLKNVVNHNMARIYDVACDGNRGIAIEEYINGITLAEYMDQVGVLKEDEVCAIVMDLCNALSQIHQMGVVHRDIKPENIMISNDGVIKLIDFGIARVIKGEQSQDTTILGTEGYAAPEQCGYAQTDARSDIYAAGVLMNKMLTGMLPTQCLYSVAPVGNIIKRCVAIDAQNRFQSVQEFRDAVEKVHMMGNRKIRKKDNSIIRWLPGFITDKISVNIAATFGYLFLILSTIACMRGYNTSLKVFLLEFLAVFVYVWVATLVGFNVAEWDKKIYPFYNFPRPAKIAIRITLWFIIFGCGAEIENYVKYQLLGMVP